MASLAFILCPDTDTTIEDGMSNPTSSDQLASCVVSACTAIALRYRPPESSLSTTAESNNSSSSSLTTPPPCSTSSCPSSPPSCRTASFASKESRIPPSSLFSSFTLDFRWRCARGKEELVHGMRHAVYYVLESHSLRGGAPLHGEGYRLVRAYLC